VRPPDLARWAGWPYRAGAAVHGAAYRRGLAPRRSLGRFTVSVGALHFGGAGKTPLVMALAGAGDGVLIRGYGGRGRGARVVVCPPGEEDLPPWARTLACDGQRRPAREWSGLLGDEAALIAARLPGLPVGVGADRARAAGEVLARAAVRRWLLDDGFSHHRVLRDADVVMVPVVRSGGGEVRPAPGPWREGRAALARASVVVIIHEEQLEIQDVELENLRRQLHYHGPVAVVARRPGPARRFPGGEPLEADALRGLRTFAVSALGRPRSWHALVRTAGGPLAGHVARRDHHRFLPSELRRAERLAAAARAEVVLTSHKDAVRLPPEWTPTATWIVLDLALHWERGRARLLEATRGR